MSILEREHSYSLIQREKSFREVEEKEKNGDNKETKPRRGSKNEKDKEKPISPREFIAALAEHIYETNYLNVSDLDCDAIEVFPLFYFIILIYFLSFSFFFLNFLLLLLFSLN